MNEAVVDMNRGAFNWCLANSQAAMDERDDQSAAVWLRIAAQSAYYYAPFGEVASAEMEKTISRIAKRLPMPSQPIPLHPPKRWMHVVTEVCQVLGLQELIRRWIERDDSTCIHDIVSVGQNVLFPDWLGAVAAKTGGTVTWLDRSFPEIERAAQLRQLAWEKADVVMLYVYPYDVVPMIAFGVAGGPPVLLFNVTDHVFWLGASIPDLIVDLRPKGQRITELHRGRLDCAIVPIPLPDPPAAANVQTKLSARSAARAQLGIPVEAILFLTIGQSYKYRPMTGLNFYSAAERILLACDNAWLIAVGPTADERASAVSRRTNGRFLAVGTQRDLAVYHTAADIYLEGFPIGSLTALLEASLSGLPCVRTPQPVPLLFCSSGEALDDEQRPTDVAAYIEDAIALARADHASRRAAAANLSDRVRDLHSGDGWTSRLHAMKAQVPRQHLAARDISPSPMPNDLSEFWITFVNSLPRQTFLLIMEEARRRSLKPRAPIGVELWKAIQHSRADAAGKMALKFHAICPLVGHIGHRFVHRWVEGERMAGSAVALWPFADCSGVRRAVLRCFMANPIKAIDASLWKMLAKSMLGKRLLGFIREFLHSRRLFKKAQTSPNSSRPVPSSERRP